MSRLLQRGAAADSAWDVIPEEQLESWNCRLLQTAASFYQYPFWSEPFRQLGFRPVYLTLGPAEAPRAYACVLSTGVPGFRIGLVQHGPVNLVSEDPPGAEVFAGLARWARQRGYVFLRFDSPQAGLLERVRATGRAFEGEPFPFLHMPLEATLVQQRDSDDEMLAGFQTVARRQIRAAERFGYEVRISDSDEELARAWPLMEMTAERKGFHLHRPLASWRRTFELGRPHRCAGVCTVYYEGRPIQSLLFVRDRIKAAYLVGGLDLEALGERPTPGCLLHWRAMREAHRLGCKVYDLGGFGDEKLLIFKRKFRPTEVVWPPPVTLVLSRLKYTIWKRAILPGTRTFWPWIKRAISWRAGRKQG